MSDVYESLPSSITVTNSVYIAGHLFQNSITVFDAFDKLLDAFDKLFDAFDKSFDKFHSMSPCIRKRRLSSPGLKRLRHLIKHKSACSRGQSTTCTVMQRQREGLKCIMNIYNSFKLDELSLRLQMQRFIECECIK